MTPRSARPLNKVSYATIAGLLTALLFWALRRYTGVTIDAEGMTIITGLVTALVAGVTGYLTPLAPGEVVPKATRRQHEGNGPK